MFTLAAQVRLYPIATALAGVILRAATYTANGFCFGSCLQIFLPTLALSLILAFKLVFLTFRRTTQIICKEPAGEDKSLLYGLRVNVFIDV